MNRRGVKLVLLLALWIASISINPLADASAMVGGRPANLSSDNPRSQSIFLYTLEPGEVKTDRIFLSNSSDKEQTVEIYPVDGTLTNIGSYTCEEQNVERDGVGDWVELEKSRVILPARSDITIGFDVTMPEKIDAGEYNGCIVIQPVATENQISNLKQAITPQAVRIAIIVPGNIYRTVKIDSFNRVQSAKSSKFDIKIKNNGNVSADVDIKITTSNIFGNIIKEEGGKYTVIGDSKLSLMLDDRTKSFWGGFLSAKASIAYDKRAGVYGTYDKSQLVYDTSQEITYFVWPSPWALVSLVFGISLIFGFFVWIRQQKYKANHEAKNSLGNPGLAWTKYTVVSGDTLELLASKYDVSVSKLSTLNKISSSDSLQEGQLIYVPKRN
ncbi:LysM peptidoglycan-binding domain-containing protein [Candidatus Saccharibacteria bacterium]|nr:LysM peptidoglycan-binding domain-containing protein [Candidatus Saccharibacteria bacterium]NCU40283.1 LysM peptidoglycan-binding domain-containing protein [Candidatus Saccharibacteria bacterium]